jgi:hypothetical protein
MLEREEKGEKIEMRRADRYTSEDLHHALFLEVPAPKSLEELKEGVKNHVKSRYEGVDTNPLVRLITQDPGAQKLS